MALPDNFRELITARLRARYGDRMPIAEAEAFTLELLAAVVRRVAAMPADGRSLAEKFDDATRVELTQ
jgi:hypothetical protein